VSAQFIDQAVGEQKTLEEWNAILTPPACHRWRQK
jgi:hypothetical protein